MVLAYLGRPVDYARLLAILQIGPLGAPRRNVWRLTRLGLDVTYREATFSLIATHLQAGQPVIAFVDTGEFEVAWLNCDNACAVVTVRRPT